MFGTFNFHHQFVHHKLESWKPAKHTIKTMKLSFETTGATNIRITIVQEHYLIAANYSIYHMYSHQFTWSPVAGVYTKIITIYKERHDSDRSV